MFLTHDLFVVYAMKAYDNSGCKTIEEFEEDFANFAYLKKLCKKNSDESVDQLLNVVLTILNVFLQDSAIRMMFFKVQRENWSQLKTILTFLERMPETILDLQLINSDIPICLNTAEQLRKI